MVFHNPGSMRVFCVILLLLGGMPVLNAQGDLPDAFDGKAEHKVNFGADRTNIRQRTLAPSTQIADMEIWNLLLSGSWQDSLSSRSNTDRKQDYDELKRSVLGWGHSSISMPTPTARGIIDYNSPNVQPSSGQSGSIGATGRGPVRPQLFSTPVVPSSSGGRLSPNTLVSRAPSPQTIPSASGRESGQSYPVTSSPSHYNGPSIVVPGSYTDRSTPIPVAVTVNSLMKAETFVPASDLIKARPDKSDLGLLIFQCYDINGFKYRNKNYFYEFDHAFLLKELRTLTQDLRISTNRQLKDLIQPQGGGYVKVTSDLGYYALPNRPDIETSIIELATSSVSGGERQIIAESYRRLSQSLEDLLLHRDHLQFIANDLKNQLSYDEQAFVNWLITNASRIEMAVEAAQVQMATFQEFALRDATYQELMQMLTSLDQSIEQLKRIPRIDQTLMNHQALVDQLFDLLAIRSFILPGE